MKLLLDRIWGTIAAYRHDIPMNVLNNAQCSLVCMEKIILRKGGEDILLYKSQLYVYMA